MESASFFGEPIDAVSGAFLITATDFILSDIREPLRITRKYSSINKYSGLYGRGWKFLYEGRLGKYENKIHVDLIQAIMSSSNGRTERQKILRLAVAGMNLRKMAMNGCSGTAKRSGYTIMDRLGSCYQLRIRIARQSVLNITMMSWTGL
ncbi:MAG: DUF6531 domain-containing protein [Enterocloster bolteae]